MRREMAFATLIITSSVVWLGVSADTGRYTLDGNGSCD